MHNFSRLEIRENNNYYISSKKPFVPLGHLKKETVEQVFQFSYDMTFGGEGEHRGCRSGGEHKRRNGEIFANAFQGKLAECAVYNQLYKKADITKPDFETYGLGRWDDTDFCIDGRKASVKSTKSFGNLLLLETYDWNENGVYIPNNSAYDFTFLVRIDPYCEQILQNNRMLYSDNADFESLKGIVCSPDKEWCYDVVGFVTLQELQYVIQNKFILPKGAMLNGKTKMDAENYYIQAGDMHDIKNFEVI